jgi:hypothetical protein
MESTTSTPTRKPKYSIFFPLLVLAIGVFLLINNFSAHPFQTSTLLLSLWPLLFIVGGLDSIYKREGLIGSLIFIGLGTILLMSNLGYSSLSNWHFLLRYWPVLIIALGLDIIFPLRNLWVSLLGLLMGFALIIGIVYMVTNTVMEQSKTLSEEQFSVPAAGIEDSNVDLQMSAGTLKIGTQAKPANRIDGTLNLFDQSRIFKNEYTDGKTGYFSMKSSGIQFLDIQDDNMEFQDAAWNIQLNKNIPTSIDSVLIAGEMTSELSGIQQLDLENTVIFGQNIVILPEKGDVNIYSSVIFGQLEVSVPQHANAMILIDTALDTVDLPAGFKQTGNKIYSPDYDVKGDPVTIKVSVPFGDINIISQP